MSDGLTFVKELAIRVGAVLEFWDTKRGGELLMKLG